MFRRTTRMFKKLVVFLVIVTMVTPSVVLGVDYPQLWDNSPWDNLPEIEPFYFDPAMISKMDHFTDGDSVIELEYLDIDHGLDPALIEQILNEQANAWLQDPYVQATLRFHELINGTVPFSSLPEDDRQLILQRLNIYEGAFDIAAELFLMMERDRLSLA